MARILTLILALTLTLIIDVYIGIYLSFYLSRTIQNKRIYISAKPYSYILPRFRRQHKKKTNLSPPLRSLPQQTQTTQHPSTSSTALTSSSFPAHRPRRTNAVHLGPAHRHRRRSPTPAALSPPTQPTSARSTSPHAPSRRQRHRLHNSISSAAPAPATPQPFNRLNLLHHRSNPSPATISASISPLLHQPRPQRRPPHRRPRSAPSPQPPRPERQPSSLASASSLSPALSHKPDQLPPPPLAAALPAGQPPVQQPPCRRTLPDVRSVAVQFRQPSCSLVE